MSNEASTIREFVVVDTHKRGNTQSETIQIKEVDGNIIVKQFSGVNCENFVIKSTTTFKQLAFSFSKLNGIYYINLNGVHFFDYKKFIHIISIQQKGSSVKIRNVYFGDIYLDNTDVNVVYKSLETMAKWISNQKTIFGDIWYFLFN
ncbi:hypothetical protein EBU95_02195 [bacterium]|nr:hypothetical protein [bacterium]